MYRCPVVATGEKRDILTDNGSRGTPGVDVALSGGSDGREATSEESVQYTVTSIRHQ